MKTLNSIRFTLLTAVALFTHATFAAGGPKPPPPPPPPQPSSGTVVLDLPNAYNWGLAAAASGWIYAVGSTYTGDSSDVTSWRQSVLSSSDSGSSWSVLEDYAPPGRFVDFEYGLGGGIALDPSGNLYVTGTTLDNDLSQPAESYVRRSTDGGATWATVDNVTSGSDEIGIAVDAAGDVYVSADNYYVSDSILYDVWTIRKGVGGTAFSTLDVLPNSAPKDVLAHPTAGIFVVGRTKVTIKGHTGWAWLVRRSTDGGATWSNVDTFQLSGSADSAATGVGANASGIYVVGSGSTVSKNVVSSHWIVRKSTDSGNSWITVDDYQLVGANYSSARCIATDANGNLVVAGSGAGKWIVRKSAGGSGPWTTVDVFQNGSFRTEPNAIAADAFGNVFVGGFAFGSVSDHWLVKKY